MAFFIIFLCLSLERLFLTESLLQRAAGFNYYLTQVGQLIPLKWQRQPYGLLLILLPAILLILILQLVSIYYFSKLSIFLLEAIILFYCLGPMDIYHASTAIPQDLFDRAYMGLFSVLFWFVLLGPMGAVLFRLLERIAHISIHSATSTTIAASVIEVAKPLTGYLSWFPIRFFIGIQAVFGKFPDTLRYWLDHLLTGWTNNAQLMTHSGYIAIDFPINNLLGYEQYTQALKLFDKILFIFLGMVGFYTLLTWVI